MRFDGESAKSEPNPCGMPMFAAPACLSKLFKDVFLFIRRNAFPVVDNGDDRINPVALNIYPDSSISSCEL